MRLHSRLISRGLSLLEVIASVVIVTIALAAITPAITLAILSRLHSERVETGNFLAQQEIERIRSLVDKGPEIYTTADLPAIAAAANFSQPFAAVPAPGSPTATGVGDVLCWDQDTPAELVACNTADFGNGTDYLVQIFRDQGQPCRQPDTVNPYADSRPCVFNLGVRVFFYQAYDNGASPPNFNETVGAIGTSGSFQAVRERPLAYLTTEVIASQTYSLRDLCLQQTPGGPCPP